MGPFLYLAGIIVIALVAYRFIENTERRMDRRVEKRQSKVDVQRDLKPDLEPDQRRFPAHWDAEKQANWERTILDPGYKARKEGLKRSERWNQTPVDPHQLRGEDPTTGSTEIDEPNERRSDNERDRDRRRRVPANVRRMVWERDGHACVECGATEELHYDHIIPFSKGGTSKNADNIQLLCQRCNLSKGSGIQ